jgi:urease accessory protein
VNRGGKPLVQETMLLDPAHGDLVSRLGGFQAIATLLVIGPAFIQLRDVAKAMVERLPPSRNGRLVQSASPLGEDALLLRMAGATVEEVLRALRGHLKEIPAFLGNDPWRRDASLAA